MHGSAFLTLLLTVVAAGATCADDEDADNPAIWLRIQSPEVRNAKSTYDRNLAKAQKDSVAALAKLAADRQQILDDARRKLRAGLVTSLEAATKAGALEASLGIRDALAELDKSHVIPLTFTEGNVPRDAVVWNGHVYQVFDSVPGVIEAYKRCRKMHGHLIRIQSPAENLFVMRLTAEQTQTKFWIDGTDVVREGDWRYANGRRMRYINWDKNEPNPSGDEDWILFHRTTGKWQDHGPRVKGQGFICEWDKVRDAAKYASPIGADLIVPPDSVWNLKSTKAKAAKTAYDDVFRNANRTCDEGVAKVERTRRKAEEPARRALLRVLDLAMRKATQRGDLPEALRLRDARLTLVPAPPDPENPDTP